jgi:hypothetical protein
MTISGLPFETSWQDLKDFARQSGLDVVYSEVGRDRDSQGNARGYVTLRTCVFITCLTVAIDLWNMKLPVISQPLLRSFMTPSSRVHACSAFLM